MWQRYSLKAGFQSSSQKNYVKVTFLVNKKQENGEKCVNIP